MVLHPWQSMAGSGVLGLCPAVAQENPAAVLVVAACPAGEWSECCWIYGARFWVGLGAMWGLCGVAGGLWHRMGCNRGGPQVPPPGLAGAEHCVELP